jgi:signal peptidase II
MNPRKIRVAVLVVLTLMLVGCDQASKHYATEHLRHTEQAPLRYLGDTFRIQYALNPGAFLGLGGRLTHEARFWLFTVMNAAVMIGLGTWLLTRPALDRATFLALALILAGGVGNLIDRARLGGFVIDFFIIDLTRTGIPFLRTGIFNVADMAITAGFLLLLPKVFRKEPEAAAPGASVEAGG